MVKCRILPHHMRTGCGVGRRVIPLLLFLALVGIYLATSPLIEQQVGDTLPARYLPFALLTRATFALDGLPVPTRYHHALRHTARGIVSDYPVIAPLLALPVYVPFVLAGVDVRGPWPARLEKLSGALTVAASAAVLLLALRRLTAEPAALALALIYGLGTSALSINASSLWQHGPAALTLAAAVYCVARGRTEPAWLTRSALPLALTVLARPPMAVLVLPLLVYALMQRPGLVRFALWGLPPVAFHVWYSLTYFGVWTRSQYPPFDPGLYTTPLDEGLYGLTLGPGRGLFVYSPIFMLSVVGACLAWRRGGDGLLRAVSVGVVPLVVLYAKSVFWNGGLVYGSRYLGDLNVSLVLLLLPVVPIVRRSRAALAGAALLVTASVVSHAYGAVVPPTFDDIAVFTEELWVWRRHPLVALVTNPGPPDGPPEPFLVTPRRVEADVVARLTRSVFRHDESLVTGVEATNRTRQPLVLYAGFVSAPGLAMPYGAAALIPGRGLLATPVDPRQRAWFRPLTVLQPGARFDVNPLLHVVVHHSLPPGPVTYVAALVEPGSSPWRVIAADIRPFMIGE